MSTAAGKDTAAPAVLHGTLLKAGPHPSDLEPLGQLEQLVQRIQLWGSADPYLHGLADEVQNIPVPLFVVMGCSFCSALDWPCGSNYEYFEHFLSAPACTAYGFAVGWQCDSSSRRLGE